MSSSSSSKQRKNKKKVKKNKIIVSNRKSERANVDEFEYWDMEASFIDVLVEGNDVNVDNSELGFTEYWANEGDEIIPACGLLALGFFCFLPWVFGAIYVRSRSPTAKAAGMISAVLGLMLFAVTMLVLWG